MIFKNQAEAIYKVETVTSAEMEAIIARCGRVYRGIPEWANPDDDVKTINFAKSICSETARLATLAIGIKVEGSARAKWLQGQVDRTYGNLRNWVEYGCAGGTLILKPNGKCFDAFTPADFIVIQSDENDITGVIFIDRYNDSKKYYKRLEYHRFDGDDYIISNKAYVSESDEALGVPVELEETRWKGMMEETPPIRKADGTRLDAPMYGVFRTPQANNMDMLSPLGLPVFYDAMEELRDLDVAYSRMQREIFDSEKIILADDAIMFKDGNIKSRDVGDTAKKLPHYIKNVMGSGADTFYQEINPALNTAVRIEGINALLSQIGYKCGFSNGYFVFNQSTGIATATQIEAEQQRTIQYIKDVRDRLKTCIDGALYALSIYADLYNLAPSGDYEARYNFGDVTYSYEADKAQWWQYVVQGKVPAWMYFSKFEDMTEEEAKAMAQEITESQANQMQLFSNVSGGYE